MLTADGGVPTMTGRQSGGPQPNVQRVAATFRRGQRSATGSGDPGPAAGGRMARLMAAPQRGLVDNSLRGRLCNGAGDTDLPLPNR